jgi:hypothetical protein
MREYQRRRRAALKKEGRCIGTVGRCKCENQARPGRTMCETCSLTFNEYQAERARIRKEKSDEDPDT